MRDRVPEPLDRVRVLDAYLYHNSAGDSEKRVVYANPKIDLARVHVF